MGGLCNGKKNLDSRYGTAFRLGCFCLSRTADLGIFTADLGATVSGNQVLFAESAYSADSGH